MSKEIVDAEPEVLKITEEEYNNLTYEQKKMYPRLSSGCSPSHSNYYIMSLLEYLQNGGSIRKETWENLHEDTQSWIKWSCQNHNTNWNKNL